MSLKERQRISESTDVGLFPNRAQDRPDTKCFTWQTDHDFEAIAENSNARLTVHVRGELDVATRPILAGALAQASEGDASVIYVDVAGLTFVDACGVSSLVSTQNALRKQFRHLSLVNVPSIVSRLIALTGLSGVLYFDDCSTPRDTSLQTP